MRIKSEAVETGTGERTYRVDMCRYVKLYVEYQGVVEVEARSEEDAQERAEQMMEKEIDWCEVGTYGRELINEDVVEIELADDDGEDPDDDSEDDGEDDE